MPDPARGSSERSYATALGFYIGDRVELHPEAECGYVDQVYGSDDHAVTVKLDNGTVIHVEDFDLTRVA